MEIDELLARAMLWRLAARAFWYPDSELVATLNDQGQRDTAEQWGSAIDDDGQVSTDLRQLWAAIDATRADGPALPEEYLYLFARHVRVPIHETSYRPALADRSVVLAELGGFYAAFGFQTSASQPEAPDHASAESEFMATLLAKEAYARANDWAEQARVTQEARAKLVKEHLRVWLPGLTTALARHARIPFYPAAAALGTALLAAERIPVDAAQHVAASAPPENEMECAR
ncbi:MAG: molecular chaperone TorD family protein [Chloroflexi bacterium]|nr:molecular chaperone TorD family protein [Chloroflexota bacterium]